MTSLLSILTNGTSASTSGNAQITVAQAKLDAAKMEMAKTQPISSVTAGTSISSAAKLAAIAKADNAKDFLALVREVRHALDAQYAKGAQTDTVTLDQMSGRALSAMVLNKDNQFTRAEQAVARMELKQREQKMLSQALSSGLSIASLANYGKALAGQYDAMSAEERTALGYSERIRMNAVRMAGTVSPINLFRRD